jgi:hypothetical protein
MHNRYKNLIREKWPMNVVSKHLIEETEDSFVSAFKDFIMLYRVCLFCIFLKIDFVVLHNFV